MFLVGNPHLAEKESGAVEVWVRQTGDRLRHMTAVWKQKALQGVVGACFSDPPPSRLG